MTRQDVSEGNECKIKAKTNQKRMNAVANVIVSATFSYRVKCWALSSQKTEESSVAFKLTCNSVSATARPL